MKPPDVGGLPSGAVLRADVLQRTAISRFLLSRTSCDLISEETPCGGPNTVEFSRHSLNQESAPCSVCNFGSLFFKIKCGIMDAKHQLKPVVHAGFPYPMLPHKSPDQGPVSVKSKHKVLNFGIADVLLNRLASRGGAHL